MNNNPAGSTWKKWDLHVHTPLSLVHNYDGHPEAAWEAFLTDLEALPSDFKVIGINDYIFVEGYEKVRKAKMEGGRLKNIDLILPVVELRLDKFAGVVSKDKQGQYSRSDWNRINLHVIFDALEPEKIRQQFLSALTPSYKLIPDSAHKGGSWQGIITPESLAELGAMIIDSVPEDRRAEFGSPLQEGFNNLCLSHGHVMDALKNHQLAGRFLIAVGKTEWDHLKWDDQSIAEKKTIINGADIVFTASENPAAYASARKKLSSSNVNSILLDCSDAHALSTKADKDRIGNCFTWIKADATFEGLRQALTEFEDRVYVGDLPPKRQLVDRNRTKYAKSLRIRKKADSPLTDAWFSVDVPLNHDLVAIIGNKGSGKSAMADIAALVGGTKNVKGFSFLNEKRFRHPKGKLAAQFIGTLTWQDGTESERSLDLDPAENGVERLKYLPQSFLETLCNELGDGGSSTFDTELRKIIYTHVPHEEQLGFSSMDELLSFKVAEIDNARDQDRREMSDVNAEILQVEQKLSIEFKESLREKLELKRTELAALEAAKPTFLEEAPAPDSGMDESKAASDRIQNLDAQLEQMRSEEKGMRDKKAIVMKRQAALSKIGQAIDNHKKTHDKFVADLAAMLAEADIGIPAADLVRLQIDSGLTRSFGEALKIEGAALDSALSTLEPDGMIKRREAAETEVALLKSKLGEKQRLFVQFKESLATWEQSKVDVIGSADKPNSLSGMQSDFDSLALLPAKIESLKADRTRLARQIHELIVRTADEYRRLYQPVQAFVKSAEEMDMPLPLGFDVRVEEIGFKDQFLAKISRQSRGSFAGVEESELLLRGLLKETNFGDAEAVVALLERMDDMLHFDRREVGSGRATKFTEQLRKGTTPLEVLDYVYGMNYLLPRYSLTFGGQEISQLSPGERGLLLLVFYLLVDKDDIPIVIDQPEENLDNQTIFKVLVKCIKAAKQRRQVIMVTHNPNLAVVCDAEQIICASCDKGENTFTYISGAIEAPDIKARVVEILEGTEPAFKNRKRKYGL